MARKKTKKRKTAKRRSSGRRGAGPLANLASKVSGLSTRVSHLESSAVLKRTGRKEATKLLRAMEDEVY